MPIITISRSFCSNGETVAEKVAEAMGCECISREILLEASRQFNVPEIKLARAIHDGPTVYDRFTHGKARYIAFIEAALLNHLKKGNIVYHGLAGHFFVQHIPHILKVRLIADLKIRIREEMMRENVPEALARKRVEKDDKERANWSAYLYKMDTCDPELYDLSINVRHLAVDDCVAIICQALEMAYFNETSQAKELLQDLALSASIKAAIVHRYHAAIVTSRKGKVVIKLPDPVQHMDKTKEDISALLKETSEMKELYFDIKSNALSRTSMRK